MISQGVLFGLLAMLGFGFSKIPAKMLLKKIDVPTALTYQYLFMGIFFWGFGLFYLPSIPVPDAATWARLVYTSVIGALAVYCFFHGITRSKVSLVSPIANASLLLTIVLSLIFYNERPLPLQWVGIIFVLIGVFFISQSSRFQANDFHGVKYGLITLMGWGVYWFLVKPLVVTLGALPAAMYLEVLNGIMVVLLFVVFPRKKLPVQSIVPYLPLIALMALLVSVGSISFNIGITTASVALVVTLMQCSGFVTVIASYFMLGERITHKQKLAVAGIIMGLVLVAL
jgi:bacterial/archaeal transporter family protein